EAPVDAVGAAPAQLEIAGLARFDRPRPRGEATRAVVGMHGFAELQAFQLRQCHTEIVFDLAVDIFELAGWRHQRDEGRDAVQDRSIPAFAAQGFLGALALVDIGARAAPSNDPTGRVGQPGYPQKEPAISAVGAPE